MVKQPEIASPETEGGFEGSAPTAGKVLVGSHPKVCNCKLCSLEYCDCSEEQQGTVKHTEEYWEKK